MIVLDRLCKQFGNQTAVDALSFSVPAGQIVGFLGPNGAGKSTTLKMLTGMLEPTSGSATICGFDLRRTRRGQAPRGLRPRVWSSFRIADRVGVSRNGRRAIRHPAKRPASGLANSSPFLI